MKFRILCSKGDVAVEYDNDIAEVKFEELQQEGLVAFSKAVEGGKLVKVDKFDPELKDVTWLPKLAGG